MFETVACCGISILAVGLIALAWRFFRGSAGGAWCANPACTTGACTDLDGNVICDAYDDA